MMDSENKPIANPANPPSVCERCGKCFDEADLDCGVCRDCIAKVEAEALAEAQLEAMGEDLLSADYQAGMDFERSQASCGYMGEHDEPPDDDC